MTRTPLESQDQILYPPLPTLSAIPTLSCAKLHTVQNTQTLQQFLSPLYTPVLYALRSASKLQAQAQGVIELKILIFHLAPLTFLSVKSSHSHLRQLVFLILGNPLTTRT